jgi:hypothetical protein
LNRLSVLQPGTMRKTESSHRIRKIL